MPMLIINTNVSRDKIPDDFLTTATEMMSKQLGKPEKYFSIRIHPDIMMSHGGSTGPCADVQVVCIGKLGAEFNKGHSSVIGGFISEKLGIPKDRFYIGFQNMAPTDVGYNGTTF